MVVDIVPQFVPAFFQSMYVPVLYGGLIVAFIGLMGIAIEKRDIQILILTDLAGLAMLIIVATYGSCRPCNAHHCSGCWNRPG